jgi:hypothetical protein
MNEEPIIVTSTGPTTVTLKAMAVGERLKFRVLTAERTRIVGDWGAVELEVGDEFEVERLPTEAI